MSEKCCCTEVILYCVPVSNQLQQWTDFCTNFSPKKWGSGGRVPLSKKVGDAVLFCLMCLCVCARARVCVCVCVCAGARGRVRLAGEVSAHVATGPRRRPPRPPGRCRLLTACHSQTRTQHAPSRVHFQQEILLVAVVQERRAVPAAVLAQPRLPLRCTTKTLSARSEMTLGHTF